MIFVLKGRSVIVETNLCLFRGDKGQPESKGQLNGPFAVRGEAGDTCRFPDKKSPVRSANRQIHPPILFFSRL
jgi:hypothetical protein